MENACPEPATDNLRLHKDLVRSRLRFQNSDLARSDQKENNTTVTFGSFSVLEDGNFAKIEVDFIPESKDGFQILIKSKDFSRMTLASYICTSIPLATLRALLSG